MPNFRVEGEIEEKTECNLEKQLIVAWNESIQFINNSAFLHLSLVLAENTELFEEVKYYEEKVWIVTVEH